MQNEFQPAENQTPLAVKPAAPLAVENEADAQAVADITKRLDEITRQVKRAKFWGTVSSIAIIVFYGFGKIIEHSLPDTSRHFRTLFDLILTFGLTLWLMMTYGIAWRGIVKFDAEELAKLGGVRAIAPLFAALQGPISGKQADTIRFALMNLLPQMKANDANLLTLSARRIIHSWLGRDIDGSFKVRCSTDLRLASLKALEQVGDSDAISVVEGLTKLKLRGAGDKEIKQAALDCLPMLRTNCGEVEAARTLLRASHAEAARPDTLLRPASGAGDTAAQELLRPSDANET